MTDSSANVLVVDDSLTMRSFVVAALEAEGFEVAIAKNGFEALVLLAQDRPFRIIITDVNMPTINGLEIVRKVRENPNRKETPIIIISTDGRDTDREKGMKLGANTYLVKPFKPEALIKAVQECIGQTSKT